MGSRNQTQTSRAEPWSAAQPYLQRGLEDAAGIYDRGGFAPDSFTQATGQSTFADPSQATTGGLAQLMQSARGAGNITPGILRNLSRISFGQGAGEGEFRRGAAGVRDAMNASSLSNGIDGFLAEIMGGNRGRFAMKAARDNALGAAVPAAVAQFAGSGMANGSTAMDTVGRAATEAVSPFEYGFEESNLNRGMQAAGLMQSAQAGDLARMMAGGQALAGIGGAERGMALQAAGMMPETMRAGFLPAQMMLAAGAQQDQINQGILNAQIEDYNYGAEQDLANLQGFADLAMRYGGLGGTNSQTRPGPSTGQQIGGAALGGLGAYGALAANPVTAPFAAVGGLASGLLGLF